MKKLWLLCIVVIILAACSPAATVVPSSSYTPFQPDEGYIRLTTMPETKKAFTPGNTPRYFEMTAMTGIGTEQISGSFNTLTDGVNVYGIQYFSLSDYPDEKEHTFLFFCYNPNGTLAISDELTIPIDQAYYNLLGNIAIHPQYIGYVEIEGIIESELPDFEADENAYFEYLGGLKKSLCIKNRASGDILTIAQAESISFKFWDDYVIYNLDGNNIIYRYNLRTQATDEMTLQGGFLSQVVGRMNNFQIYGGHYLSCTYFEGDVLYYNLFDLNDGKLAYCLELPFSADEENFNAYMVDFDGRYFLYKTQYGANYDGGDIYLYDTHTSQTHHLFSFETPDFNRPVLHGGKVFFAYYLYGEYLYCFDPETQVISTYFPKPEQLSQINAGNSYYINVMGAVKQYFFAIIKESIVVITFPDISN